MQYLPLYGFNTLFIKLIPIIVILRSKFLEVLERGNGNIAKRFLLQFFYILVNKALKTGFNEGLVLPTPDFNIEIQGAFSVNISQIVLRKLSYFLRLIPAK